MNHLDGWMDLDVIHIHRDILLTSVNEFCRVVVQLNPPIALALATATALVNFTGPRPEGGRRRLSPNHALQVVNKQNLFIFKISST